MKFLKLIKSLKRQEWEHYDPKVRIDALQKIEDKEILVKIAKQDPAAVVREAAGKKIQDQELLIQFANTDKDSDVRKATVSRIEDREVLRQIAKVDSTEIAKTIIEKIDNEEFLKDVFNGTNNVETKILCLMKICDDKYLYDIALSFSDTKIRSAAMKNIKDELLLSKIKIAIIDDIKTALKIGITKKEIISLLGPPSASRGGDKVMETIQNLGATTVISPSTLGNMSNKEFCEWDRPEGKYRLVIQDGRLSNILSVPECNEKEARGMEYNKTSKCFQTLLDWFDANPLEIGNLSEFKLGQKDFSKWGDGIVIGTKDRIINKLCSKLKEINAGAPYLEKASNYSWQRSDLENYSVRIQSSIPGGMLAGHYVGKIGKDQYALFGYGIDHNEGLPVDHD